MSERPTQIIAMGGGGFLRDGDHLGLEQYILRQTAAAWPRVAFVPTASGEPDNYVAGFYAAFLRLGCRPSVLTFFKRTPELRSALLDQDVIYVGGGNTKTLLAVWRDWGVPEILHEAWKAGVVLAGVSAGAICWFEQGLTDSFADGLRPLEGLGFLPGSCCPHYDGEPQRRPSITGERTDFSGTSTGGLDGGPLQGSRDPSRRFSTRRCKSLQHASRLRFGSRSAAPDRVFATIAISLSPAKYLFCLGKGNVTSQKLEKHSGVFQDVGMVFVWKQSICLVIDPLLSHGISIATALACTRLQCKLNSTFKDNEDRPRCLWSGMQRVWLPGPTA